MEAVLIFSKSVKRLLRAGKLLILHPNVTAGDTSSTPAHIDQLYYVNCPRLQQVRSRRMDPRELCKLSLSLTARVDTFLPARHGIGGSLCQISRLHSSADGLGITSDRS